MRHFPFFYLLCTFRCIASKTSCRSKRGISFFVFCFFSVLLDAESTRGRRASPRSSIPRGSERLLVDRRAERRRPEAYESGFANYAKCNRHR
uniref:Uncharacterized protein n=1 Tax=Anguilla anguilla TaxID=7936 RepID=A0A0E9TH02_ANGAN